MGGNKPATCVGRTSGPDEPVADEHTYNAVSTFASDEPVTGLIPYWPGSEDSVVCTCGQADKHFYKIVHTSGPDEPVAGATPYCTGRGDSVVQTSGQD